MGTSAISIKEKIGYGMGDTACNIVFQIVINFLLIFYTDVFGIGAAAAGTLLLVVRLFDGITDPIMGGIADRTSTKYGKYRPYLLWMALPYAVLGVLAFNTPDASVTLKLVYAYVTYTLLMTVYTAINIPYSALGGVMSKDSSERASIQSYRFALAMLGGALTVYLLPKLVKYFGNGDESVGYPLAMMVFGIAAIICFALSFVCTKERVVESNTESQPMKLTSIFKDGADLRKNSQWVIIATITFFLLTAVAMRGSVTGYYIEYFFDEKERFGQFLSLGMLSGVAGALSANFLRKLFCKVAIFKWAIIVTIFLHLGFLPLSKENYSTALFLSMAANFAHMLVTAILFSMVPDTVEYGKSALKTVGNRMAMSFAGHLLALKFGIALGGAAAGWSLAYVGYVANAQQTESTLNGIVWIYSGGPIFFGIIIVLLLRSYFLTNTEMTKYSTDK
tara:strand:+ start:679 stop:2025 length:1347 start_codon:yes stop_codon:yes gene_type:complete